MNIETTTAGVHILTSAHQNHFFAALCFESDPNFGAYRKNSFILLLFRNFFKNVKTLFTKKSILKEKSISELRICLFEKIFIKNRYNSEKILKKGLTNE